MQLLTWKDIKSKIQKKHSIETDDSYDEQTLVDIYNEACNMVEAEIITLNQDYFLTTESIGIIVGQSEYDLPDDIYASKIRRVFYKRSGYKSEPLRRVKNLDDMADCRLKYIILNKTTGRKLVLNQSPAIEAELEVYFTRNANRFTVSGGDSQVCDIPEWVDAVTAWMSYLIELNDKSPTTQLAKDDYNTIIINLKKTLAQGVNDEDNTLEPDISFDMDHV